MPQSISHFLNQILCGDAQQVLRRLPDESVDCVVTSPPYWALRDYGVQGQLGLEANFEEYIEALCRVFDQVQRVLKSSGTCFVNLGDTYSTRNGTGWSNFLKGKRFKSSKPPFTTKRPGTTLPGKSLMQIPSRFAIKMSRRGWILRNEIIWWKPNAMPSSAKDRFTVDYEKVFFFVKSRYYFFNQQFEPVRDRKRLERKLVNPTSPKKRHVAPSPINTINPKTAEASRLRILKNGRNKRCVWPIATRPFADEHFAVYPPELIETPIKAGCPKRGVVLDPFVGSGTTAVIARTLERKFIGIDLNPEYVKMAQRRLAQQVLL